MIRTVVFCLWSLLGISSALFAHSFSVTAETDTLICLGDTLQFAAPAGSAYSWSPNLAVDDTTLRAPRFFPTQTRRYIVSYTDPNGLVQRDSLLIRVDTCALGGRVEVVRFNCFSAQYTAFPSGGVPPYTFQWSGTGGLSGNTQSVSNTYPTAALFLYNLIVVDARSDTLRLSGTIEVQNTVVASAGPDDFVCALDTIRIGPTSFSDLTYQWSAIDTTLGLPPAAELQQARIRISDSLKGGVIEVACYQLEITDSVGCTGRDTICIEFRPRPSADFTVPPRVCEGQFARLAYSGTISPGLGFSWDFGEGRDASGAATANTSGPHLIQFNTPNTGPQTVSLRTTFNGCPSPLEVRSIDVVPTPTATFTVLGPVCVGQAAQVVFNGVAGPAANFTWNFAGGSAQGTGRGPYLVTYNTPGTRTITLSVSDRGCAALAPGSQQVTVNAVPTAIFSSPGPVCQGDTAQFTYQGNAGPGALYSWSFDGGGFRPVPPGAGPVRVAWASAGNKTVTLNVQENGCTSPLVQRTITVKPTPQPLISSTPDQCLNGNRFDFSASGVGPGGSYQWTFFGGQPAVSTLANPTGITYQTPGRKTVTLQTTVDGCTSPVVQLSYDVIANPSAAFSYTTSGGTLCTGDTVTFQVANPPAGPNQSFLWLLGTDAIPAQSSLPNPGPVTYTSGGVKRVEFRVDNRGCADTSSVNFRVEQAPVFIAGAEQAFCEGDGGVQLDAQTAGGRNPLIYQWGCNAPACGISNRNIEDPFVNPLGSAPDTITYFATVTDAQGCRSNVDSTRVIIHPKPIVNAGPDATICEDGPGANLLGGLAVNNRAVGPFDWRWTDSAGNAPPPGIVPPNDRNPTSYTRPNATTIYVLIATDQVTGCSSEATTLDPLSTAVITVQEAPTANTGARDTVICLGDTIRLNGSGSGAAAPYSYAWSPVNTGYISDPDRRDPFVSPRQTTTYSLVVTASGCDSRSDSITVFVETIPTLEAGSDRAVCLGDTIRLRAVVGGSPLPQNQAYRFQWTPSDGLSDPAIRNPIATPPRDIVYRLRATSRAGCGSVTDSLRVRILSTPVASVVTSDTTICRGDTLTLRATHSFSTTLPAVPVLYRWANGPGIVAGRFSPDLRVTPDSTAFYSVETRVGACATTDEVRVAVNQQPDANIVLASGGEVLCEETPISVRAEGGFSGSTYAWEPAGFFDDPRADSTVLRVDTARVLTLTVREGACVSVDTQRVRVRPRPEAFYRNSTEIGCAGLEVSFAAESPEAVAFVWNFGDGSPLNNDPVTRHIYDAPGVYPVTLIAIGPGGCADTASLTEVRIDELPTADFSSIPSVDSGVITPQTRVVFAPENTEARTYVWDFGDGGSSNVRSPSYVFESPGTYDVSLTITSPSGCINRRVVPYEIDAPQLFIPNLFSPNGDGNNETFSPNYAGTESYRFTIYDRWGTLVFQSDQPDESWDGVTASGREASEGVYYYLVEVGGKNFRGNVTLLR